MRKALIELRDKIAGNLALSRTPPGQLERIQYWGGYLSALRHTCLHYGRVIPEALTFEEYTGFQRALDEYSGAGLSVQIEDDLREPSPEGPELKPCSGISSNTEPPDGTLFCDDPRTAIKLGGG